MRRGLCLFGLHTKDSTCCHTESVRDLLSRRVVSRAVNDNVIRKRNAANGNAGLCVFGFFDHAESRVYRKLALGEIFFDEELDRADDSLVAVTRYHKSVADEGDNCVVISDTLKCLCGFLTVDHADRDLVSVCFLIWHNEVVANLDLNAVFFVENVSQTDEGVGYRARSLFGADELIFGRAARRDGYGRCFGSCGIDQFRFRRGIAAAAVTGGKNEAG